MALCLGTNGDPTGLGVSNERGTPGVEHHLLRTQRRLNLVAPEISTVNLGRVRDQYYEGLSRPRSVWSRPRSEPRILGASKISTENFGRIRA